MLSVIRDLLKYDRRFLFGFVVILILIFLSIFSFLSPYDPRSWHVVPLNFPPSLKYLFGTNSLGQDLFWTTTHALRNSLFLGLLVVLMSRTIAVFMGLTAGYKGGSTDRILMSVSDSFIIMPQLPILIFLSFTLRGKMDIFLLSVFLAMFGWPRSARVVRSLALSLREREFTYTAVFSGMNTFKVILKEHLPFIVPLVMAQSITNILWAIGMEITMAVFGLGISLDTPTLGTTIQWAIEYQSVLRGIWWWILIPVVICIFLAIGLYMLSTSLSEFLDPRTRLQRIKLGGQ